MDGLDEGAFQVCGAGFALHLLWSLAADQLAAVHQAYAIAALGFVQLGRGH
jgi:hypothetical protein